MVNSSTWDNVCPSIISMSFNDPDQLVEVLSELWGETYIDPLCLTPFQIEALKADFGDFVLCRFNLFSPVHHWGDRPKDFIMFCILLGSPKSSSLIQNYCQINASTMWGFDPTRESNSIYKYPGTSVVVLLIKKKIFYDYCQLMDRDDLLQSTVLKKDQFSLPLSLSNYRNYIKQLFHLMEQRSPLLKARHYRRLIVEDMLPILIDAIPRMKPLGVKKPSSQNKTKLAFKAREYILEHLQEPLTLKELYQAIGTSQRNLFYSFEATFGMTPMKYIKAIRLQGLRRELKRANPQETLIMSLADRWGFWSAGHLARDYKKMFGELPSETLRS